MKKYLFTIAVLALFSTTLTSCDPTEESVDIETIDQENVPGETNEEDEEDDS